MMDKKLSKKAKARTPPTSSPASTATPVPKSQEDDLEEEWREDIQSPEVDEEEEEEGDEDEIEIDQEEDGEDEEIEEEEELETEDEEEEGAERKSKSEEQKPSVVQEGFRMDKPRIWIRIKDMAMDGMYEIGEDRKTLRLMICPEDRLFQKKSGDTMCFSFETEGIFQGPDVIQEDIYETSVRQIVDNALHGVSGVVVCVGPEQSGKSFTLFGPDGDFENRGVVQRALEDIFAKVQHIPKGDFHIVLSMFEVRRDKMRDLFTLRAEELTRVGNFGPKGLFFEEVLSIDHAIGLILRGLEGQRILPCKARPSHAKYHTLVYIDLLAPASSPPWRSRITFAKIASLPPRSKDPSEARKTASHFSLCRPFSGRRDNCYSLDGIPRKCCGGPQGPLAENISVRKDMYFLEQMFTKCYDVRRITEYYNELEKLGMYMLMSPPNTNPSQYFRQSKLANCLKDIVSGDALVRLILHVRPERDFLHSTLENMRFAERVRYMPCGISTKVAGVEDPESKTCGEDAGVNPAPLDHRVHDKIHQEQLKDAFKTAATYFEEKLDALEGTCKDQMKPAFEEFKQMWEGMLEKEFADANPDGEEEVDVEFEEGEEEDSETVDPAQSVEKDGSTGKKVRTDGQDPRKSGVKLDGRKSKSRRSLSRKSSSKGGRKSKGRRASRRASRASKAQLQIPPEADEEEEMPGSTTTFVSVKESISGDNSGPNQDMSITVIPVGTADPTEGGNNSLATNLHFKCKCWQSFAKTEAGIPLVAELEGKQQLLNQYMNDHAETLKDVVGALSKLVAIELNLDQLEPNRRFSDETSGMNLLTTKEQRMETAAQAKLELKKLQEQQSNISELTNALEATKHECDKAFDEFCDESSSGGMASKNRRQADGELGLRYDQINRIAKEEARILIRRSFPTKPEWTTSF